MAKAKHRKNRKTEKTEQVASPQKLWRPRADVCYKQIKNQVQSLCGLKLPDENRLVIVQDLGEITDHTPIKTIMHFDGYDTLMTESSYSLSFLSKTQSWASTLPELLDQMGMHGDENYLMAKRTKLFFALQAWANVRQTFRVDCADFAGLGQPLASDVPLSLFEQRYFPYSSFYVELMNYSRKEMKCGERLAATGVPLGTIEEVPTAQANGDIAVPTDFFFKAALAVASILKNSAEEFILREYREVKTGKPAERLSAPVHDYKWFLKPRTTYPVEQRTAVKVPLDQLIPPDKREVRERMAAGTHASPSEHMVRSHYRVYWCGPRDDPHPEFRWIKEFVRGSKPRGVVQAAEVIHQI